MTVLGLDFTAGALLTGAITGLGYGLLATGLILVYRATRIINFAHGEIGAFCALVLAELVLNEHWAFLPALAVALAAGAAIGIAWERVVLRPLRDRPRLVLLVATVGISQVMSAAQQILPTIRHPGPFPSPLHLTWDVAGTVLTGSDVLLLIVAPAVGVVLIVLWRTQLGLAIRAAAENLDAARLAGIPTASLASAVFGIAGVLAAISYVLIDPIQGTSTSSLGAALGPSLLLRALIAALAGRMWSIPQAMAGGVLLGAFEGVVLQGHPSDPGVADVYLLGVLVLLLLVRGIRDETTGSWALAPAVAPLSRVLLRDRRARVLSHGPAALAIVVAIAIPFVLASATDQFTLTEMVIYAIAGLSIVVVTGWTGELSLAQFAFVGAGALLVPRLESAGFGWPAAVVVSAAVGAIGALLIGLPALRIRGVQLAVVTLGVSVAASNWLFQSNVLTGGQSLILSSLPRIGHVNLADERTYYFVCLVVLLVVAGALSHLRRTGAGRAMLAVRDNEPVAAAMTVWPTAVRIGAFALGGAVATLAGALLGGLLQSYGQANFPPDLSLTLLGMAVMGGVGSISGTALAAAAVIAIPALIGPTITNALGDNQSVLGLVGGVGLCLFLIAEPGGLGGQLQRQRERLIRRLTPSGRPDAGAAAPGQELSVGVRARPPAETDPSVVALQAEGVHVSFGGVRANDGVSIRVGMGEIVGLLGTNGSGKTTLMNATSGTVPLADGAIALFGEDMTKRGAVRRSECGMARVFQDGRLYESLTVAETLAVSMESRWRSSLLGCLLALPPFQAAEWSIEEEVEHRAAEFGLTGYLDRLTSELSMGTRRVVELACIVSAQPRMVLLDEPTAGIAQREAEAFGPMICRIRDSLGCGVLLIEHDIPLLLSVCDRIYVMNAGRVLMEGLPDQVRNDPRVIAAYLGADARAIDRSGAPQPPASPSAQALKEPTV
jgi:ABC-type branched-subunit amino acid transport system ATPase component/branched-subunit amino acid ABC-type transport system permease component